MGCVLQPLIMCTTMCGPKANVCVCCLVLEGKVGKIMTIVCFLLSPFDKPSSPRIASSAVSLDIVLLQWTAFRHSVAQQSH